MAKIRFRVLKSSVSATANAASERTDCSRLSRLRTELISGCVITMPTAAKLKCAATEPVVFGRFLNFLHDGSLEKTTFETIAGVITAEFFGENVRVQLSPPFDLKMEATHVGDANLTAHSVNTGVPHAVVFVDDLPGLDIVKVGAATRYHDYFAPKGTNANFVQVNAPGDLSIRTYERGVENETLACGTGMAACAIIHHQLTGAASPIKVTVAGGDTLEIGFEHLGDDRYENVTLLGPADFTFEGQLTLDF